MMSNLQSITGIEGEQIGHWFFERQFRDGFGTERTSPRGFITVTDVSMVSDRLKFEGLAGCRSTEISEYFLHLPPSLLLNDKMKLADLCAGSLGAIVQFNWPLVTGAERSPSALPVRLCRNESVSIADGYERALAETDIDADTAATIAALQRRAEQEAAASVIENDFTNKYGVRRILTVGSTSRGTYADAMVDFDLVVETEVRQDAIARVDIGKLVDSVVTRLASSAEYAAYCTAIGRLYGVDVAPVLHQSSFGVRGKESFVSRHEMLVEGRRHNLVDLTIGHLPQLVGYEIWIQRYLNGLDGPKRARLCREIRLAKKLLIAMGDLYGVGIAGFRGNVVEQLIIQGWDYRCRDASGLGSLDNSLKLVTEEAQGNAPFAQFKSRFPLWHPGWWESEVGFSPSQPSVNILDLLGGGNPDLAEQQWSRVRAIALSHRQICQRHFDWTISEVVKRARDLLAH